MKFSFSKNPKTNTPAAFGPDEPEKEDLKTPFDYVKARMEMHAIAKVSPVPERSAISNSHQGPLGPAAIAASLQKAPPDSAHITPSTKVAGLVMMDPSKDPSVKGVSKHIARMKETSEVNEKFKNLLKVKVADREKAKAEEEFGQAPEEFITGAYLKQKQQSLELEKQLEANESQTKKKDVANLFKELLGSGSYARTNFQQPKDQESSKPTQPLPEVTSVAPPEIPAGLVKRVLDKIVPESSAEVAKAIEERAKLNVLKIVEQIAAIPDLEDREEIRMNAKERYLERKRLKQQHDNQP